jgi:DNA-binding MltR family transcriptional regulator
MTIGDDMVRYKVVFKEGVVERRVFGDAEFLDPFVKVLSDEGNVLYINKSNIIFMKEILDKND